MEGLVLVQAVQLSIGAAVAAAIFGSRGDRTRTGDEGNTREEGNVPLAWKTLLSDVGATCLGAIFLALSIAPADEVCALAVDLSPRHLVAVVLLSLVLNYTSMFVGAFSSTSSRQPGPFQGPVTATALAYSLSLLISLGALYPPHRRGERRNTPRFRPVLPSSDGDEHRHQAGPGGPRADRTAGR